MSATASPELHGRDALDRAISLAKKGGRVAAYKMVAAEVRRDPHNADAWVVMAQLVDDREHEIQCWERVLKIYPDDPRAQARLTELRTKTPLALDYQTGMGETRTVWDIRRERFTVGVRLSWRTFLENWSIFRRNRLAMFGLAVLAIFALAAISYPFLLGSKLWPRGVYHPETGYDVSIQPWPAGPRFPDHILGVDIVGRDILSMLLASTRPSFTLAIVSALATALVSTFIGALSAYYRGIIDSVFAHLADALLLLPIPILMVIIGSRFYADVGTVRFGLIYGLLAGASSAAIVMRSHALTLMTRSYIDAARLSGAGPGYIIMNHLIPHMLPLVLVHMMITVTGAVVADGFIAWMGLRTDLRLNWGTMVYSAFAYTFLNPKVPWAMVLAPTFSLSFFAAAFYFVARGLQDIADPRQRGER